MIADTTFIIDVMTSEQGAVRKAKELAEGSIPLVVTAPTIFELYVGVGLSVRSSEEKRRIHERLDSLTQLPLDSPSARRAGLIHAQKTREGSKVEPEDSMIAGIAVESKQAVLTRNTKDFVGIPDLKFETY